MNIKIENTLMIERADVKLDGLTVLAGDNDTGKSSVGKLMFSIIKSISRYEEDYARSRKDKILRLIEDIYFNIRSEKKFEEEFKKEFYPPKFFSELTVFFENLIEINYTNQKSIDDAIQYKKDIINKSLIIDNRKQKLIEMLDKIKDDLLKPEDKNKKIKKSLDDLLSSEFLKDISQKNSNLVSDIIIQEGNSKIFSFHIANNEISNPELFDICSLNDVTLIDSPIILQMYSIINNANTLDMQNRRSKISIRNNSIISLHFKDLIQKAENAAYFLKKNPKNRKLIKILNDLSIVINGTWTFDSDSHDFFFINNSKNKIRALNTASGIKSFGLIQLLIQAEMLDDRSLLIIDEPENHLHPMWQLKYAEMIIELVKNNIKVLISSHSPYMIQALKLYSDRNKLENMTNFYLAEIPENSQYSVIEDVTDDLNKIFIKLSEPLDELI